MFGKHKVQAIHAKCGGIKPIKVTKGVARFWSNEAIRRFVSMSHATNNSRKQQGVIVFAMSTR